MLETLIHRRKGTFDAHRVEAALAYKALASSQPRGAELSTLAFAFANGVRVVLVP